MDELINKLKEQKTVKEKINVLKTKFSKNFDNFLQNFNEEQQYLLSALLAIGQGQKILENKNLKISKIKKNLEKISEIEKFYEDIGGIIGYHNKFLELLNEKNKKKIKEEILFHSPNYFDIRKDSKDLEMAISSGLDNLDKIAAIFPLGGAGDRLGLFEKVSKKPKPVAKLEFLSKNLLQIMIEDLEALENLYFQKFNKQLIIPIALMTSDVKDNHNQILEMLENSKYFNRPKEKFLVFKQILVPMITEKGNWIVNDDLDIQLKPGGHGMLWKQMKQEKVFDWLYSQNIQKALVRQVNNPVAGIDYGFLALFGYSFWKNKSFGFAACPRRVKSAEGVNILREVKNNSGYSYSFSNIEYTDFEKHNILDVPIKDGGKFSKYPSNTNILFVDLKEVEKTLIFFPFPGAIINMKSKAVIDEKEEMAGRLELMMQNIADHITDNKIDKIKKHAEHLDLKTFLTYNKRSKTISVTKKQYQNDQNYLETPVSAYLDVLENSYDLLKNYCKIKMPKKNTFENFLKKDFFFIFTYHSALGPKYKTIAKKIKNGEILENSEIFLNISNFSIEKFVVDGSFIVIAKNMFGRKSNEFYSNNGGRCFLKNVVIKNSGIDKSFSNDYPSGNIKRLENFKIVLEGDSEFICENVQIDGNLEIIIKNGFRKVLYQENGILLVKEEKIKKYF